MIDIRDAVIGRARPTRLAGMQVKKVAPDEPVPSLMHSTPKRGTLSPSLLATSGASSGRSFGTSASFAKCRTSVETVGHPRFPMPLSWTQTIPSDKLPTRGGAYRRSAGKAHSGLSGFNAWLVLCPFHRGLKIHFCETNPIARDHLRRHRPMGGETVPTNAQAI